MLFFLTDWGRQINSESLEKASKNEEGNNFCHSILYFSYFICCPCSTSTFLITKTQKIDCKGREFFVFEKITSVYLFQTGQQKK